MNRILSFTALSIAFFFCSTTLGQERAQLTIESGDHICLIGNTLAERMQHDGWLETLMHAYFPNEDLTIRNLGFSADELSVRLRSLDFGSQDQWLAKCKANVVFAFFGYNESFADEAGLAKFKTDLDRFVEHTLAQSYGDGSPTRLVLFSPIAHEEMADLNLPRGDLNNRRIGMYSDVMAQTARENNVPFVDLFALSRDLYRQHEGPLTINGVHLNDSGNEKLAKGIVEALFPGRQPIAPSRWSSLREAVLDKNFHWFHRYRTTDGYSTYGGRADLAFTDGQTNREVVQRELEVLDFMTADRDQKIWATARNEDYEVDDSKSPPFIPVITNKPGPLPDGKHEFLDAEEAIAKMDVHENMQVNLFASEEMFPELASPVQMSFDTKGRLWVAVWPTYPHWQPKVEEMNDKLLIFEDSDRDGRADKVKVFADGLHNPTGFEFWNGGVLVGQAPDIMFLKDTDGDDVADVRERILHGIDSADTHHTANSFTLGPGGGIYFQEGTFHHTQVETPWGPPVRNVNAGVYRFDPRTFKFEVYVAYPFANPHGHVFDSWGQDFVTDGTGNVNYFAAPFSGHLDYPDKHRGYFPFFQQWVRPSGGTEILSSTHFPEEFQGNYLIANCIGFLGLLHYRVEEDESGFRGVEVDPILRSSDPNFRPVDIEMGPDGAIYMVDWQNPIIGHMQHNLRDPNRDKVHGRVYRVTYRDRPLSTSIDLSTASLVELFDQLKSPESRVRYRARIELSGRNTREVLAEAQRWLAGLSEEDSDYEHHRLEALWVTQQHNQVDQTLLRELLRSPEPRARAAATRALCYTRERFADALDLLSSQVNDPFPRVRLEAVRACSFFTEARAADVALQVLNYPMDKFLDYSLKETIRGLEKYWKPAIAAGEPFSDENEAGLEYVMDRLSTAEVARMKRGPLVFQELLSREGVLHDMRHEAAMGLAMLKGTDANTELLSAIARLDQSEQPGAQAVLADLTHLFLMHGQGDFSGYQSQLDNLAASAQRAVTRQVAYATLIKAEKSIERVWETAVQSPDRFRDFVNAVALIDDQELKSQLHPRIFDLLSRLPMKLADQIDSQPAVNGRYVRVELPGEQRTLTLAEVQVMSDGRNIAPGGRARQSGRAHGGRADRAIDGNRSGVFSDGGQTHTPENRKDPWWELDLGGQRPIDAISIWNRTDGDLGKRLEGFTLQVLDEGRRVVFERQKIDPPDPMATFQLAGDQRGAIERAAIHAVVHTGGGDQASFAALADLTLQGKHRSDAIRALNRMPGRSWVEEKLSPLVSNVINTLSAMPASERTEPSALDELELGKRLAAAMPRAEAEKARLALNELGVNVVVLRPIPHRMQYDRSQFFVEAGKPFQIVFENTDIMPHNIVITAPGAYAKVGIAAELMATEPDAVRRQFVPNLPEVLHASRMLQPSQVERLNIVAPSQIGDYPYVCTFPGHWRRMYGTMHVVASLSDVPLEALAPTTDPGVATRPFVRDWKMDDLLADVQGDLTGRSFETGAKLFTELSCAQCHRMGTGEGGEVGPNLADLQAKFDKKEMDRVGLLRELIEPSHLIDEKFKTWIIQDVDGRMHSGVVAERTDDSIRLLANPLDKEEPVTIAVADIEDEMESKISMMPLGLLNTLNKDEILDLLMYIETLADSENRAFSK